MKKKILIIFLLFFNIFFVYAQTKREMRAVWIATVNNIDWSPKNEFEPYRQREAMLQILDTLEVLKINTLIFQIRPTADTFYKSEIETWSRFLTGNQGVAPYPFYDPLAFVIDEAHKRNIEVHIWLNPYRVLNVDNINMLNINHLYFKNPKLFVKYGGQYYFNPGYEATRQHLKNVVADLVSRYDIEAIHIDDYFYPYPIRGEEFPDNEAFKTENRGFKNKDDWRRNNVNLAIDLIFKTIKEIKPWVEFGVSPFGVWRNKSRDIQGSDTKALANYDDLYADILKWLKEGKIDYVMPQLYWEIGHANANYSVLADWWSKNCCGRNLYIGLYASNLGNGTRAWREGNELVKQIKFNRKFPNIQGVGLYSAVALMENRMGIKDSLKNNFFKYYALVPANNLAATERPQSPENVRAVKNSMLGKTLLYWDYPQNEALYFVVYYFGQNSKIDFDNPKNILKTTRDNCLDITNLTYKKEKHKLVVTAVNRFKIESEPLIFLEINN
jgi:uncharacterized lipoprotein YddW (UPF0748 family)